SSSVLEVVEGVVPVGEFEEDIVDREDAVEGAQATPADAGPSRGSQAASGDRSPQWRVRARRELSEDYVLEEVEPGSREAARVLALHQSMKARARLYADHLEQLATFFREDPEVQGLLDEADVTALKVATGLRCTYLQAHAQVRDAHLAVEWMPHTFAHLRAGGLPEAWHHWLLRQVRRLTESQVRQVDADMAGVEIPSVSKATFDKHVGLAVARASADTPPSPPSKARDARIVDIDPETGTASLCVTGPIPEIQALAHRLDIAARTVQSAQRAGLEDGAEGPLPFDIDEDLRDRGTPLSLRALRYAILTHSILDIDPLPVQEPADRPGHHAAGHRRRTGDAGRPHPDPGRAGPRPRRRSGDLAEDPHRPDHRGAPARERRDLPPHRADATPAAAAPPRLRRARLHPHHRARRRGRPHHRVRPRSPRPRRPDQPVEPPPPVLAPPHPEDRGADRPRPRPRRRPRHRRPHHP